MSKSRKTGIIGIIITIVILIILIIATNMDVQSFEGTENVVTRLVMPAQNGLTSLRNRVARQYGFFRGRK